MKLTRIILTAAIGFAGLTACTPQEVAWWGEHPEALPLLAEHSSDTDPIYPGQPAYEPCMDDNGVVTAYASDDPGQTSLDCDVRPPQTLSLVWDEVSWGDHESWGSDASYAWAEQQALDFGCTPVWQPTGYLIGTNCDY